MLGFDVGDREDGALATAFLRGLKTRGLRGVHLVIGLLDGDSLRKSLTPLRTGRDPPEDPSLTCHKAGDGNGPGQAANA